MKKNRLPFWLGLIMGMGAFVIVLLIIFSFPDIKNDSQPTAVLNITPYLPSPTLPNTPENSSSIDEQETSIPGVFTTDMHVQVINTGGDGLKIHSEPAIESDTLTIAPEGSLWIIIEGPTILEGRVWWKMWSDENGTTGWAVQDYLTATYQ